MVSLEFSETFEQAISQNTFDEFLYRILTLKVPIPQNVQSHSNNLSATVDG